MRCSHMRAAAAIAFIAAAACAPADAQTMYRCGRQYQDRPCDAGQQGRAVGRATTSQPSRSAYPECTQRGERAMKIIWAREGGATADAALSQARGGDDRQLVMEVYQKRGSAAQIRSAIEEDCAAQKEKDAQTAAMMKALGLEGNPQPQAQPRPVEDPRAAEERRQRLAADEEAARKKETCARLNGDMQRNLSSQRAGGSITRMEKLNDERRDILRQISEAGC